MIQPCDNSFETDIRHENGQQLALFVNLDGFEGPIDLLLSLARDQKVDLTWGQMLIDILINMLTRLGVVRL